MSDTREKILKCAEQLMRTRGYNGFSYADVAESVGTTKANIHHYFRSKVDLGQALIARTKELMEDSVAELEASSALDLLKLYMSFFEQSVDSNLVCLCGMLLAEDDGLPAELRETNEGFVSWQLDWLSHVLSEGRNVGDFYFEGSPQDQASFIYSTVQGAHIVAKFRKNRAIFSAAMHHLLSQLGA